MKHLLLIILLLPCLSYSMADRDTAKAAYDNAVADRHKAIADLNKAGADLRKARSVYYECVEFFHKKVF